MTKSVRSKQQAKQNRVEALRNELRARILRYLIKEGPNSPSKIAKALGERTHNVNYHVKRLVELQCAELVDERRATPASPAEHVYRATERYLVETAEWEDLPDGVKDHLAGEFAQAHIDDIVLGFKAETLGTHERFHLTQTRILVDERGRDDLLALYERVRLESLLIQDESAERMAKSGGPAVNTSSLLGLFEIPLPEKKPSPREN